MVEVNEQIRIPESELEWSFVRSGGPGGQNVNKVASKAVLRWDLAGSPSVPEDVKSRLRAQERKRINADGVLIVSSQRFRDQERNRADCLGMAEAAHKPSVEQLEDAALGLHRCVRGLVE